MKSLADKIYAELVKNKNVSTVKRYSKYHKYTHHRSFGIKASILNRLLKSYSSHIKNLSCSESLAAVDALYKKRIEECVLAGNYILQKKIGCLSKSSLPFIDRLIENLCSWSTTDDFCIDVLQPLLLKDPKALIPYLRKWNRSDNIWKRRASVVVFVRKIGESGRFTNEAISLCDNLLWDSQDLVQKGVGWCLKDIMRGNPSLVFNYIKELRLLNVSTTITLYAIRDLKGVRRSKILNIRPKHFNNSKNVYVDKGNLAGKGVYAKRNFKKGEVVIRYNLRYLSKQDVKALSKLQFMFTHVHFGKTYLYSIPERYVNNSNRPNTFQDLVQKFDIASRNIKKGEMITCDAKKDDI